MSDPPPLKIGKVVPADPTDLEWADLAAEWERNALPEARAIAEKWAGSIAGLLGIFGIAGLIGGRDEVAGLTSGTRTIAGGLFAGAVVTAVTAMFLAALAAQGGVRRVDLPTPRRLRDWSNERVQTVGRQLSGSRILTMLAVASLAAGVGIVWFGHRTASSSLRVTLLGGRSVCGGLEGSSKARIFLKIGNATRPIALARVSSIESTSSCPG